MCVTWQIDAYWVEMCAAQSTGSISKTNKWYIQRTDINQPLEQYCLNDLFASLFSKYNTFFNCRLSIARQFSFLFHFTLSFMPIHLPTPSDTLYNFYDVEVFILHFAILFHFVWYWKAYDLPFCAFHALV